MYVIVTPNRDQQQIFLNGPDGFSSTGGNVRHIVVFPESIFEEMRKFMLRDPSNEQFGFLLAGATTTADFVKLLVHDFLPAIEPADLMVQSGGAVCPSPAFQMRIYSRCKKEGHHLIDVHSHPFDASDNVHFSGIDDRYEFGNRGEGVFGFTASWIPGIYHASIVVGQNSLDARIYRAETGKPTFIDEIQVICTRRIIPVSARSNTLPTRVNKSSLLTTLSEALQTNHTGEKTIGIHSRAASDTRSSASVPFSAERTPSKDDAKDPAFLGNVERYSRQILAFGHVGQAELQKLCIGVIGAGGLGSIVVEMLARLGVGRIICVDHDIIEWSNLTRVLGSRQEDAISGQTKVSVLAHHVAQINPRVQFTAVVGSVLDPAVQKQLRNADVLVSGTDTFSSRLMTNQIAVQFMIPYINLGVGMEPDPTRTRLISAGGKIMTILPGQWCYRCLGEINQRELQVELMSPSDRSHQIERGYITGVALPDPSVIFLNMTIASLGICELLNLFVPFKQRDVYLYYDMLNAKLWKLHARRDAACPVCSHEASLAGRGDLIEFEDWRSQQRKLSLPSNG